MQLFSFYFFPGLVRNQGESEDNVRPTMRGKRLVHLAKEEVDEDIVELPPGDNLGAGGLDRCLFGHLQRNWTLWLTKSYMTGVQGKRSVLFCIYSFYFQRSAVPTSRSLHGFNICFNIRSILLKDEH